MRTLRTLCLLDISHEESRRRRISFAVGWVIQAAGIALLLLGGVWFQTGPPERLDRFVMIYIPSFAQPKPVLENPPPPKVVMAKVELPKPPTPPVLPSPRKEAPPIEKPQIQALHPVPKVSTEPPPMAAEVARPRLPSPSPAPTVHTGLFSPVTRASVSQAIPLKSVQTGGFGDPQGQPGRGYGESPVNVARLGAFDLPEGPGRGNGTGGLAGIPRIVASAGFEGGGVGETVTRSPSGAAPDTVKTGILDAAAGPALAPAKPLPAPAVRPVEILFKPSPIYTEEARRLRVEGEVVLSVVFQADGTLRVLGVLQSLGHGLDQMAEQAASQIRFKPAEQAGKPTDFAATLRIEFRLA